VSCAANQFRFAGRMQNADAWLSLVSNLGNVVAHGAQSSAHPATAQARLVLDVSVEEDDSRNSRDGAAPVEPPLSRFDQMGRQRSRRLSVEFTRLRERTNRCSARGTAVAIPMQPEGSGGRRPASPSRPTRSFRSARSDLPLSQAEQCAGCRGL
jgi:hypothetical protein